MEKITEVCLHGMILLTGQGDILLTWLSLKRCLSSSRKGFQLEKLTTCAGGVGCNEFVFSLKR